jgi:hypothetical protein
MTSHQSAHMELRTGDLGLAIDHWPRPQCPPCRKNYSELLEQMKRPETTTIHNSQSSMTSHQSAHMELRTGDLGLMIDHWPRPQCPPCRKNYSELLEQMKRPETTTIHNSQSSMTSHQSAHMELRTGDLGLMIDH